MTTLTPTYEEFQRVVSEFLQAADTANPDELEAGAKCVGLAFIGIRWDDSNPLHAIHREAGAPACLRLVTAKVAQRLAELTQSSRE